MKISSLKKYKHTFIFITSLILALISTLPFFLTVFNATADAENPFQNTSYILSRSLWYFLQSFITVLVLVYFNYEWIDLLIPPRIPMALRIPLLIVYNIILVAILIAATIYFAEYTTGNPFGKWKAAMFYMWKYIFLHPICVMTAYALRLVMKGKITEMEVSRLREENLSFQLRSLQEQVNPHFFFNTLNTLSSVIRRKDREVGLEFVENMSDVYRYLLDTQKEDLIKLKAELAFIESYKYMLANRFENGLIIDINIPDTLHETLIPPLALQMLIENAIKHNTITSENPLQINILHQHGSIVVSNTIQSKTSSENNPGMGLPNLMQRYKLLAGKELVIRETDGQFIVELPIIKK